MFGDFFDSDKIHTMLDQMICILKASPESGQNKT